MTEAHKVDFLLFFHITFFIFEEDEPKTLNTIKKSLLLLLFSFSMIAFGNSTMKFSQKPVKGDTSCAHKVSSFTLEADMVSTDGPNCYIINVRISSYNDTLGNFLVANQNGQVSKTCEGKEKNKISPEDLNCQAGTLPNGDQILPSKWKYKHCLADFLNNSAHEGVYGQYLVKKQELLSGLK